MIEVGREKVISLTDACKLLPKRRAGKRPHVSTLYRWCSHGFQGVQLEVIRIGGTLCTSEEALQRFFERITIAKNHQLEIRSEQSSAPKNYDAVERELDAVNLF